MTKDEVIGWVAKIRSARSDDEEAHCAEDKLYLELLRSIAAGTCVDPAGCAEEAIKSQDIDFQRWCA